MNDTVLIVLIIAVVVVVVLWMFRSTLSRFFIKANREGVEAELQTNDIIEQNEEAGAAAKPADVNVRGNWQIGRGNKLRVEGEEANVSDNRQVGEDQDITVKDPKQSKKK
ncbi:MAG: hypothetical protein IAE79_04435 [Anaerolinea sp.]|nr:hypothetical protein [Anaerolinea sp.]